MTYIYVCVYTTQWRKNSPFQEIVLEQLESIYKNRKTLNPYFKPHTKNNSKLQICLRKYRRKILVALG